MAGLQEYKCPCCGGGIAFNSEIQKMKCPYCETEFEMEALQGYDNDLKTDAPDEMEWQTEAGGQWGAGETDHMRVYSCKSCGGQIIGDENLGATSCPYCGNPVVMMGQFSGALRPDLVIPFKLDKEAAKAAYQKHIQGKKLLPKVFASQNHIDEIKGVYVPFWMFDADANARIRYKATKVKEWSDDEYKYKETSYYSVVRAGSLGFENVPVDGSTKMADELMESVEPFRMEDAVDFQTAYLAGYIADKYDVDAEQSVERANQRVQQSTAAIFRETVKNFDTVETESNSIHLSNGKSKYVFCPVWILNTIWNNQSFTFAMNGQTGKMVGNLPEDKAKGTKLFLLISIIATAICFGISRFMGSDAKLLTSVLVSLCIGLLCGGIYVGSLKAQLKSVHMQAGARDYVINGSFKLSESSERFLYKTEQKSKKDNGSATSGNAANKASK